VGKNHQWDGGSCSPKAGIKKKNFKQIPIKLRTFFWSHGSRHHLLPLCQPSPPPVSVCSASAVVDLSSATSATAAVSSYFIQVTRPPVRDFTSEPRGNRRCPGDHSKFFRWGGGVAAWWWGFPAQHSLMASAAPCFGHRGRGRLGHRFRKWVDCVGQRGSRLRQPESGSTAQAREWVDCSCQRVVDCASRRVSRMRRPESESTAPAREWVDCAGQRVSHCAGQRASRPRRPERESTAPAKICLFACWVPNGKLNSGEKLLGKTTCCTQIKKIFMLLFCRRDTTIFRMIKKKKV
jgi:hypothetical protein